MWLTISSLFIAAVVINYCLLDLRGFPFVIVATRPFELIGISKINSMMFSLYPNQYLFSLSHGCQQAAKNFAVPSPLVIVTNLPTLLHKSQQALALTVDAVVSLMCAVYFRSFACGGIIRLVYSVPYGAGRQACCAFSTSRCPFLPFSALFLGHLLAWWWCSICSDGFLTCVKQPSIFYKNSMSFRAIPFYQEKKLEIE